MGRVSTRIQVLIADRRQYGQRGSTNQLGNGMKAIKSDIVRQPIIPTWEALGL